MSIRVRFISMAQEAGKRTAEEEGMEKQLVSLAAEARREIAENAGFLKLIYEKTGEVFFYNSKICGIIGDLSRLSSLGLEVQTASVAKEIIKNGLTKSILKIAHMPARALGMEDYQKLFLLGDYEKLWRKRKWLDIQSVNVMTADLVLAPGNAGGKVFLFPVFYCNDNGWEIAPDATAYDLIIQFMCRGMLPEAAFEMDSGKKNTIMHYVEATYGGEGGGAGTVVKKPDPKELEEIKKHFREIDFHAAGLLPYDDTIFQRDRGMWDLYPFAGLDMETLSRQKGQWYEVDGFYGKSPVEDVAPAAAQVAIDFGTKSTTVAILDGAGDITMIPVGSMGELGDDAFENPTILEFRDIRKFMKDYTAQEYRPDTKFNDISVSRPALADYEDSGNGTEIKNKTDIKMYQYINHLKQWVNNPGSVLEAVDSKGEEIALECEGIEKTGEKLNPIEIYAYYIGRSINNMHYENIYLKYLLSYTSTYTKDSREWIRASFEKGLRKSLPPQVGNNAGLMKKFEVKLGCDEATAYAISALSSYLKEDYRSNRDGSLCIKELEDGGIFYGVYDFGGGTLDFSFGVMHQEKDSENDDEKDVYRRLKYGGSSTLGCENLLEALAFEIFSREGNRKVLWDNKIKCEKPFLYGPQQNEYQIVGHSNAARLNTSRMIAYLRKFWISGKKEEIIRLQNENGERREVVLAEGGQSRNAANNTKEIELKMSAEEIENFFCEKVSRGVRLFIEYYKEVVRDNRELEGKKCFLFLAGNASRAKRVKDCIDKELKAENLAECFCIKPPLPTESDREEQERHPGISIPTAKSGVVFGTLLARPEALDIEIVDEIPEVKFRYHIGRRKKDRAYMKGLFQLLMQAGQVPAANEEYRLLLPFPIQKQNFEILYTSNGGYALNISQQPVGEGVNVMTLWVPENAVGCFLYARAGADSAQTLELGISKEKAEFIDPEEKLGVCDFEKAEFILWEDQEKERNLWEGAGYSGYEISIRDKGEIRYKRRILESDEIKAELLFHTDSDKLEIFCGTSFMADEAIEVSFGNPGVKKELYLLKVEGSGPEIGLAYKSQGKGDMFIIDMAGKKLKKDETERG